MSKVKMIEVIAKHDLNYVDHLKSPQYRRAGSKPFLLDESNVRSLEAIGAVVRLQAEVTPPQPIDEFDDELGGASAEAAVNQAKGNTLSLKGGKK